MSSFNAKTLPAPPSKFKRAEPLDAGSYPARLVQIVGMGTQAQQPYKGEAKPPRLTMRLTYELLDEFMKDDDDEDILDKPRWVSEDLALLSLSQDLATSTKRYYALDPEDTADGDWVKLIGSPCIVTLVQSKDKRPGNDNIYNNVAGVSAMRPKEAAKAPVLVNPSLVWDFYAPDLEVFEKFPDWIKANIKAAVDYPGSALEQALEGRGDAEPDKGSSKQEKAPAAGPDVGDGGDGDW